MSLLHWVFLAFLAVPTVLVAVRALTHDEDRVAFTALAIGLTLWTAGFVVQALDGGAPDSPSPADALWLTAYVFPLAALYAFARPWLRRAPRTLLLDTLLVLLGTAAVITALVLPPVVANGSGLDALEQAVNLAYPLIDGVLATVAIIGAAVAGRRPGSPWALLALGAISLTAGDALWAQHAADGTWAATMPGNALFLLWPGFLAAAAWLPQRGLRRPLPGRGVQTVATTFVVSTAAVLLLVANEWIAVPATSVVLAALALLIAGHRSGLALTGALRQSLAGAQERELLEDVRAALRNRDFTLHYQPLVSVDNGRVKGAEALLRWYREGQFVPPDQFLPAIEQSELIRPLTDFVLDRALETAAVWWREGHEIGISVNLATANLNEGDLPGRVLHALCRHGLPAHALTLEITETAAIEDNVMATHVLRALHQLGVGLSVDDFGTGHSSLIRLARFPIRELKIDRTFVSEMHDSQQPIVATAIQLAHTLGLTVVAEGIEDAETLEALRALGCDLAQGFHISRPLPAAEFAAWLRIPALV